MELEQFSANEDMAYNDIADDAICEQPEDGTETPDVTEENDIARETQSVEVSALAGRVIRAEAKTALAELGVPSASAQYVLRLIDERAALDEHGEPDESAIRTQVQKVLSDIPALRGNAAQGFNPPPGRATDPFEEGFERG